MEPDFDPSYYFYEITEEELGILKKLIQLQTTQGNMLELGVQASSEVDDSWVVVKEEDVHIIQVQNQC